MRLSSCIAVAVFACATGSFLRSFTTRVEGGFQYVYSAGYGDAPVSTLNITGLVPATGIDFFFVPFLVPSGTAEIEVAHTIGPNSCTSSNNCNILDFGILDPRGNPEGYRGWGGGSSEPAILGVYATSRAYLTGPMTPGNWSVVSGKAKIVRYPGDFSINITLRQQPSLPPQPQRQPYVPAAPIHIPNDLFWYAGDFHVHSCESTDAFANATLDEIATYAEAHGLDFVHISDHNTISTNTFINDAQSRHPNLLLMPGVEFTSYFGHGGAIFLTEFVDFKMTLPNVSIAGAVNQIHNNGALFSINHEDMYEEGSDLRNECIGCAWDYGGSLPMGQVNALEIGIQSWPGIGFMFSPKALEWWDHLHALGYRNVAPIGGSDDHHGGQEETTVGSWEVGSPIGSPTTMVLCANLSQAAIKEALLLGRTAVKMYNAYDPDLDLTAAVPQTTALTRVGGVIVGNAGVNVNFTATVSFSNARRTMQTTANQSYYLAIVRNNVQLWAVDVTSDPFSYNYVFAIPAAGTDRWRAEVHDSASGSIHTITNHIFLTTPGWADVRS